jgi:hypothetical protein
MQPLVVVLLLVMLVQAAWAVSVGSLVVDWGVCWQRGLQTWASAIHLLAVAATAVLGQMPTGQ